MVEMKTRKSKGGFCPLKRAVCPDEESGTNCAWYDEDAKTCVIHIIAQHLLVLGNVGRSVAALRAARR